MASGRRRTGRRARPGIAWMAVSTVLLAAVGFGAGLLVGATWEEPELVLGYLRGDARPVPLDVLGEVEAVPEPSAPEPARGPSAEPARLAEAPASADAAVPVGDAGARRRSQAAAHEDRTDRRAPTVAAAPPPAPAEEEAGRFAVQVGSFTEPIPAFRLAENLGEKHYPVYVAEGEAAGQPRWRVRVGPVDGRAEADRLADELKRRERLPTWVLREEERG